MRNVWLSGLWDVGKRAVVFKGDWELSRLWGESWLGKGGTGGRYV